MQSQPTLDNAKARSRRARRIRRARSVTELTYSRWSAALFALVVLGLVGSLTLYLAWDYMPARVQYIPRYVRSQVLPRAPHPDFVPTPVAAEDPTEALAALTLEESAPVAESVPVEPETETITTAPEVGASAETPAVAETAPEPVEALPAPEAPAIEAEPDAPPVPDYLAPLPAAALSGMRHEYQGWNNCGPATLAMQLSYFGRTETQAVTAPFLKPDPDDKNVSPHELAAYADSIGFGSKVVVGGDLELLRTLVTNGFPVMVESWYIPEPNDEMGHYLLLTGYEGDTLSFFDSFNGPDQREGAAEFDRLWKVFNRTAIVLWPPEKDELAGAILADYTDHQTMVEAARDRAHAELQADPNDKFAWFNLGTNLTILGDLENATRAFDTARSLELPWRMLWYQFGPYEAYYRAGRYQDVIDLASVTLASAGNLEESFYWRGRAHQALGDTARARADYQAALKYNPRFAAAQVALDQLP